MIGLFQLSFKEYAEFYSEPLSVGYSYLYKVKKLKFLKFARINIELTEEILSEIDVVGENDKVISMRSSFDFSEYFSLPENERRIKLYEAVFNVMEFLVVRKDWDIQALNEVHAEIKALNYHIVIEYFKKKKNPSRSLSAVLNVILRFDCAEFILDVFDKKGNLINSLSVYKSYPHPITFRRFLYSAEWVNDDLYKIEDMLKEIHFVCDVANNEVRIEFVPIDNNEQELNNLLKGFDYKTNDLDRPKLLGLPG